MGGHAQFIICKASVKFHLENPKFKLGGKKNYGRQRVYSLSVGQDTEHCATVAISRQSS